MHQGPGGLPAQTAWSVLFRAAVAGRPVPRSEIGKGSLRRDRRRADSGAGSARQATRHPGPGRGPDSQETEPMTLPLRAWLRQA
jgi:hypothetical protein